MHLRLGLVIIFSSVGILRIAPNPANLSTLNSYRAPNHCGEPNFYMNGFRCKVTGNTGNKVPKTPAKPPTWCENDSSACTTGPKQILAFNQASGNNMVLTGYQADGSQKAPGYNTKCGWAPGTPLP